MKLFSTLTLVMVLLVGCYRPSTSAEQVARDFAEAMLTNYPARAMIYLQSKDRNDDTYRKHMETDATRLIDCHGKVDRVEVGSLGENRAAYHFIFKTLCGGGGYLFYELLVQVEQQNGKWVVYYYSPEVFISG